MEYVYAQILLTNLGKEVKEENLMKVVLVLAPEVGDPKLNLLLLV